MAAAEKEKIGSIDYIVEIDNSMFTRHKNNA